MAHCQICEREIKDNTGVIAHHGYQRQGGWQSNSCIGARYLSYEESRDAIPEAINKINRFVSMRESEISAATRDRDRLQKRFDDWRSQ